ncbi:hypothetical protein R3P38DRAFT_3480660 [Favolaschia claudopus]|uniref:T6SS Phospholipase effector Tle1-like catalytic domain-containing protein n=1 Tax=Favolaschia claudopus TaxID=2862362 RepID=A0AAW0CFX0_9AGAR
MDVTSDSEATTVPEPTGGARTLVVCFDGTMEEYDGDNTNAVKLFALLKKDDWREQLCYYQPGIGTYVTPGAVSPILEWGAKLLDAAFAIFLKDHVMEGYKFLMNNYHAGDRIWFSRGSYIARALAGMLHKVGLLPRDNTEQSGIQLAAGYKQTFCQNVEVEFLGVWETVASVGIIMCRSLPYTTVNASVKTFRHAVSLDEHRVRFEPYLLEPKPDAQSGYATDTLEVLFSGCHEDVGGGAVTNDTPHSLSDITLRWMIRQIVSSGCGIQFDPAALKRASISLTFDDSPTIISPDERPVDDADSCQPLHDNLAGFSKWKPLEFFPLTWTRQDVQGGRHTKFGFHLGRSRQIVDPNPNFHYTVKERMENPALKYKPKAKWVPGSEVYVE